MNIRYAKPIDKDQVVSVWNYCFEDGEDFVKYYFENVYDENNTIIIEENDEVLSALQLNKYTIDLKMCIRDRPNNGYLIPWADQGVLLLNTALTVRAHEANSHQNIGWEIFTDNIIKLLNTREEPVIFVLWGGNARRKKSLIDTSRHYVLESAHPSPLSAYRGFFGCKHFSKINEILQGLGKAPIDWQIPNI